MALKLVCVRSAVCLRCLKVQTTSVKFLADDSATKSNLYEVLGIPKTATYNEIKQAYYDLTLKYHPDRNENCEAAAAKFRAVTEAYEVLGNYALKKIYDQGLPLPVKKHAKRTYHDHKVKYQEFYDSRRSKTSSDSRSEEINELGSQPENQFDAETAQRLHESNKQNHALQFVVAVYLAGIILYSKFF